MHDTTGDASPPIRVVAFGGGPVLDQEFRRFISRLEDHPEIELLAVYCQSTSQGRAAIVLDLWRRRGVLAVPLLFARVVGQGARFLTDPRGEVQLRRKVERLSNRVHFVPDIHAREVLDAVRALAPDLGLVYGSPILRRELFEIPRRGTLGIHHGKVPEYRGKKTTFWAMYNGEPTAGVTIQRISAGLDAGDIVKEGQVPARGRSLWAVSDDLEALGIDLYLEAIVEVRRGTATYRPQPRRKGPLYRDPQVGQLARFWWRQMRWKRASS